MRIKKLLLSVFALLYFGLISSAQPYEFTNAGATGRFGPTQTQINTAYTATSLAGQVTSTSGVQRWIVPFNGLYIIEAQGASGGGVSGGKGAIIEGTFQLSAGDTLFIIVGQMGADGLDGSTTGGGGTFVAKADPSSSNQMANGIRVTPLVIAGGGGGNPGSFLASVDASLTTSGQGGTGGTGFGAGGINGNGGSISVSSGNSRGGGGGGFLTNGEHTNTCGTGGLESGRSFLNGGEGGLSVNCSTPYEGGFGGGAGSISSGWRSSGGGGGYSGGGGGQTNSVNTNHSGGGGGSFNSGLFPASVLASANGHGRVEINPLSGIVPNDAGINAMIQPTDTAFCKTNQIIVQLENFGTDSLFSATVHWSVNGIMQDSFLFSGALEVANGPGIKTSQINLGTYTFNQSGTYDLKFWTSDPNNIPDTINFNDTLNYSLQVKLLDISIVNQTNVSCHGGNNGSVLVNTHSSTATYDWGGGITTPLRNNLSAGSYFVTVTDIHNCPDTFEVTITQPDPLGHQIVSGGFAICNGDNGSVEFEGVGGTPPYNYLIMGAIPTNALNNIVPGTYAIQITDANNCVYNDSVSIINPPVLEGEIASITPAGCGGNAGAATASGSGGIAPYSYTWSDGQNSATASGLTPGDYEVTITDSLGCERVEIARVRSLDVSVTRYDPILGANNTTATSYQWINCETGEIIANETGQFFQPTQPGNYAVIVSDGTCSDTSDCFNVVNTFIALQNKAELQSQIFPNPNQGQFSVRLNGNSENNVILTVYDIQGKEITRKNLGMVQGETTHTLELNIPHGVYLVRLQSEQWTEVKRMIVK